MWSTAAVSLSLFLSLSLVKGILMRRAASLQYCSCCSVAKQSPRAATVRRWVSQGHASIKHAAVFTLDDIANEAASPEAYWRTASQRIHFDIAPTRICPPPDFASSANPFGSWFGGGKLNVAYNAVDRHAAATPNKVALLYDSPVTATKRVITYGELLHHVAAVAGVLRDNFGVQKGHTVVIYMPNCPEAVFTMLACARLGAIHSCVFGGFSPTELSKRILDCGAAVVIASSCGIDGIKTIPYKPLVDAAIAQLPNPAQVRHVGVYVRPQVPNVDFGPRDVEMNSLVHRRLSLPVAAVGCTAVDSDHPLYILYTSGTTGAPKGIVRETAGTAVILALQTEKVFGLRRDDVMFTASDIGWIVGTNFIVYGPLLHGCTSVLYEGKPVGTPDAGALFRITEEYQVKALYTAPTAFRAIKGADPEGLLMRSYNTSSMHALYLAGERTDPNTMLWAEAMLKVPVVDNWWQTETGSPMTACPRDANTGAILRKPGSCGVPCPGWRLEVHDTVDAGHGDAGSGLAGELVFRLPLPPGALSGIWGKPHAARETYLKRPGVFETFDAGYQDDGGFVSVMSRTDDIINVAGHRLSTAQMESILCDHASVAEAAVVGAHCGLKGETPLGLVVLKKGCEASVSVQELAQLVRASIGPIAVITVVVVRALPKTRSGKVLRKTIRQIAACTHPLEIPPTIEDPDVIHHLRDAIHTTPKPL